MAASESDLVMQRKGRYEGDPVRLCITDNKWYFWDETWADKYGPFDTEEEARADLLKYCQDYLGS